MVAVGDIPTLTRLYATGALQSAVVSPQAQSCAKYNDKVSHIRRDITTISADAIVNAANCALAGGGGVDGAIHRAAGPELSRACASLGGCKTGDAKITPGFNLPARYIIHTVGPIYSREGVSGSDALLESCYSSSLSLALENKCRTIAFCAVSTGVYGFPSGRAAEIATRTVRAFLEGRNGHEIDRIVFVSFETTDAEEYERWLPVYFPAVVE
ncbi:hypothetical protein BROUX41_006687 [Berkeleyomyces rouxiae]|uniref:uncharacterized protein n=1 Tax=Berkeleyomyces rouxiae TaxID=2035830 RepID=UPI003B7EE8E8